MTADALELRHFGHDDLPQIRQTLIDVHADVHAADMDEFAQKFPWFVDHWGGRPTFSCVIAYDGDEPAGFAYGAPDEEGRETWRDFVSPAPERTATFFLSELMVRKKWRKTGLSQRLAAALTGNRSEALAMLFVDTEHPKVQALYESWGFRKVGERQPFADSPLFAVMLAELPLT